MAAADAGLDAFNALEPQTAFARLLACCGSRRWAAGMTAARPFASVAELFVVADRVWTSLLPEDWREAFAAHPRIGQRAGGGSWSQKEQAGVVGAPAAVLDALQRANEEYVTRFGYIFIVCATGQSAAGILDLLHRRLHNAPD